MKKFPEEHRRALSEDPSFTKRLETMYDQIRTDRPELDKLKDYADGKQARPHAPRIQRAEVDAIRKRSVTNLISLAVSIPAQLSFADGYKRGKELFPEEWDCWIKSRMAQKQTIAFTAALTFGASYIALENLGQGKPEMKLLSSRDTVAYYHDPVNDRFPAYVLTIRSYARDEDTPGLAVYYDAEELIYLSLTSSGDLIPLHSVSHNLGETPVGRLTCFLDDEGRPRGVVEHLIAPQDRVNQTTFDLLSTQTFSAFKLRTASGVQGEPVYDPSTGEPRVDADGNPILRPIPVDPSTWVQTDNPEARFGTLDETPLDGFLEALRLAVQHFAVQGQLPPHALLGNLSNLSAETLVAAMSQTQRFVHVLKTSWGQTIVDLMELVAKDMEIDYADSGYEVYEGEVRWADMSDHTLAAQVDALGKGVQMLGIPERALWPRFPGVTTGDMEVWDELKQEELQQAYEDPTGEDGSVRRESSGGAPLPQGNPSPEQIPLGV